MNGLSFDGALARAYDPKRRGRGWTTEHELLAIIAEGIDASNRLFLSAHSKRGAQLPNPLYIPRPDDGRRRKPNAPGALWEFFARKGVPVVGQRKKKRS